MNTSLFCPTFIHPAHIQGDHLVLRTFDKQVNIQAPVEFVQMALEWCRGMLDMEQLRQKAVETWGNDDFIHFIEQLVKAGFLFDGNTALLHRWQRSGWNNNRIGRVAPKSEWPALRARLPQALAAEVQALPVQRLPQFSAVLDARHSCRDYADAPVSASQLGSWLAAGYGVRAGAPQAEAPGAVRRTVPSGGAFYPLELTLILRRPADDFAAGVYRVSYDAQGLVGLQTLGSDLTLLEGAYQQVPGLMNAAGVLVISGDLFRTARKYRNMALTLGLLEAGCVLQNLGLAAPEAGLGWTAVNGFDSRLLGQLCQLGDDRLLLTSGFVGIPAQT